jgi:sugar phosphate isomerase/epimerase
VANPVGVSLHADYRLSPELFTFFVSEIGYECVEVNPADYDVIYGGRPHPVKLRRLLDFLHQFDCSYTVHSPLSLNLRDTTHYEAQCDVLLASVEFCRDLGASVLVVHFEEKSPEAAIEERFGRAIRVAADQAAKHSVVLAIENIETERMDHVVDFVRELNHPNVGMTIDFGHAYLAANKFGYSFLDSISAAAPYARHLHISDNFGRFAELRSEDFMAYRPVEHEWWLPAGLGDLHLPPGWGTIPLREACGLLTGYSGAMVVEYRHARYRPWSRDILNELRRLAAIAEKGNASLPAGRA